MMIRKLESAAFSFLVI